MGLIIVARTFIARMAGRPPLLFAIGMIGGLGVQWPGEILFLALTAGVLLLRPSRFALVLLGLAFGGWRLEIHARLAEDHVSRLDSVARSRLVESQVVHVRGDRIWVECRHVDGTRASGRIQIEEVLRPAEPGQFARFIVDSWTSTEGSPFLLRQGILVRARFRHLEIMPGPVSWSARWWALRKWFRSRLSQVMDPEAAAFLGGLLLGMHDVPPRLGQALRDTGTSHLLVISGMHFVLVYAIAGILARLVVFHRRWWLIALGWTLFYGALVIMSVPVLRALIMVGLHALAHALRRSPDPISVLSLAAIAVLIIDPADLQDPSFQLSFAAVLALILFPRDWLPSTGPRWLHGLLQAAAATVVCLLFTAPIVAFHFHQYSPITVAANLALGPFFSALLFVGLVCLIPGVGWIAGGLASVLFWLVSRLGLVLASAPASSVVLPAPSWGTIGLYLALLALWLCLPRFRWGGLIVLLSLLTVPAPFPESRIVRLAPQTYLIQAQGTSALLNPGPRTQDRLNRLGVRSIDWALLIDESVEVPRQVRFVVSPERHRRLRADEFVIERGEEAWRVRWREFEWRFGTVTSIDSDARFFGGRVRPELLPPGARLIPDVQKLE